MVNYDAEEGVTVSSNSHKSSILTVQNATIRHEGNYTCAPANARPTSISVHVLKGKWWEERSEDEDKEGVKGLQ